MRQRCFPRPGRDQNPTLVTTVLACCLATASTVWVPAASEAQERRYGASSVPGSIQVGSGFETLRGEVRQSCVTTVPAPQRSSQSIEFEMTRVTTSSELARSSGMAVGASFDTGIWSGSMDASLARLTRSSEHSVRFVARIMVTNSDQSARSAVILPDMAARPQAEFRRLCGNGYVSSVLTGGEFVALIEYDATSAAEAQAFASTIRLAHATGGDATASFREALSQFSSTERLHVRYSIRGVAGHMPQDQTVSAALEFARQFPGWVQQAGQPFSFRVTQYPIGGVDFGSQREDAIGRLADQFLNLGDRIAERDDVLGHPDEFEFPIAVGGTRAGDLAAIRSAVTTLTQQREAVRRAALQCMDATQEVCTVPATSFSDLRRLPARLSVPDTFGVTGGCTDWSESGLECLRCDFSFSRTYTVPWNTATEDFECPSMAAGRTSVRATMPGVTAHEFGGTHQLQSGVHLEVLSSSGAQECNHAGECAPGAVIGRSHDLNAANHIVTSTVGTISARLVDAQCISPNRCNLVFQPRTTISFRHLSP